MHELNGQAKAMVVTESREGAVRYHKALEHYVKEKDQTLLLKIQLVSMAVIVQLVCDITFIFVNSFTFSFF